MENYVVGPYFFEQNLNEQEFLGFFTEDFPRLIEHLPDQIKNTIWFQLDGAPVHFLGNVREELSAMFPDI